MVGVGLISGTIAAANAPKGENKLAHATIWAGSTAAVTGVASLYLFDEEAKRKESDRKLEMAMEELRSLRHESSSHSMSAVKLGGEAPGFTRDIPVEYQKLVRPGKWTIYEVNQWVAQGENTLIHQDKILRIEPPSFNPNQTKGENP
jgi:predicted butyrate kinase (DUF1464 family)